MTEQLFLRDGTTAEATDFNDKGKPFALGPCTRCGGGGMFGPTMVFSGRCFACHGIGKQLRPLHTAKKLEQLNRANKRRQEKRQKAFRTQAEIWGIQRLRRSVRQGFWAIEEIRAKATRQNAWIGEPCDRRDFKGTVRFIASGEGKFGTWFLTVIDTDAGTVTWWNAFDNIEKGDKVTFKATIKKHDERDGEKQTVVTRAKIAA